jgi:hypothetical protein
MNPDTMHGGLPSVINPSMMNGNTNNNNIASDKKPNNKNAKVTLDKNGKPKRKKASRGELYPYSRVKGCLTDP